MYFSVEFTALRLYSETEVESCAGRLEVFYNGTWGSVGRRNITTAIAGIVCRQLGCGENGVVSLAPLSKIGSGFMWVDDVQCSKTYISIWQCLSAPWERRISSPAEETWITCEGGYLSKHCCHWSPVKYNLAQIANLSIQEHMADSLKSAWQ